MLEFRRFVHQMLLFVPILCMTVGGCATLSLTRVEPAPDQYNERLDQLVIHTNFPVSKQQRLLQELQGLRSEISTTLQVPVSNEPVHVYLFQDAERFGDFVRQRFPTFPARRAFFIETDTQLAVYAHWGDRIAEDLRHEVSHGYMHSMVHELPLWLDEGLAENFEVAQGQHGINPPHIEELRHALLSGRWKPDLAKLEQLNDSTELSQRHYAESWLWVHWMLHSESATSQASQQLNNSNQTNGSYRYVSRSEVLHSYIRDIHNNKEKPKSISERLAELRQDVNEDVVRYLQSLPGGM